MVRFALVAYFLTLLGASTTLAQGSLDIEAVNKATFEEGAKIGRPLTIKLQILLDRAHASPGIIDGRDGNNLKNALRMFEERSDMPNDGKLDPKVWDLLQHGTDEVLVR